jgi:hypothetical protein
MIIIYNLDNYLYVIQLCNQKFQKVATQKTPPLLVKMKRLEFKRSIIFDHLFR